MRGARALCSLWLLTGCERELWIGELLDASLRTPDSTQPNDGVFGCDVRGPLYTLRDGAGACGNDSSGLHYALCSCGDIAANGAVQSDGFDSRSAAYAAGQSSGALAMGGAFYPHPATVGGSLIVAGENGIPLNADLAVGGNLFDHGQLQGAYAVTVGGRARIGGDVRVSSFSASDITVSSASAYVVTDNPPAVTRATVDVPAPCDCNGGPDIAAIVSAAERDNDDATLGVDPESWLKVLDAPVERTLACGRYFVNSINAQRTITLHVQGRVALYVADGVVVDNDSALRIDLAAGAELDIFIANNIAAGGVVQLGDVRDPTRTRLHMGGDSAFFSAQTTLASTLYAPHADLVTQGPFELYGAGLVKQVDAAGTFTLHFDRALAADSCAAARCQSDADCGDALRCDHGSCLP